MNSVLPVIAAVAAYLIGSLSFAVIVSSLMGLNDPRTYGSGNPGATNVLRSGSKAAAALTLLLDAFKGLVPVLLVKYFGPDLGLHEGTLALVAIAAFLGHLFPVFFKFKGGKGVATALGVLLGISGWLGLFVLLTWLFVAFTTRYSSLSALIAAVLAPAYYIMFGAVCGCMKSRCWQPWLPCLRCCCGAMRAISVACSRGKKARLAARKTRLLPSLQPSRRTSAKRKRMHSKSPQRCGLLLLKI